MSDHRADTATGFYGEEDAYLAELQEANLGPHPHRTTGDDELLMDREDEVE